mgnify:CR=1 FL=1
MRDKDVKFVGTKEQEKLVSEFENNKIEYYIDNNIDFVIDNINIGKWRKLLVDKVNYTSLKECASWSESTI